MRDGRFVLVRIYDTASTQLVSITDDSFSEIAAIKRAVDAAEIHPLEPDAFEVVTTRLEGLPFVGIAVPLVNSENRTVAQVVGVFAISPAAIERIRGDIVRTILYVIGIVVATTLAVYPIIGGLLGRLSRLMSQLLDANLETLQVLGSAIAKRDSDTDAHNYRVSVYAVRLAEKIGLPRSEIRSLIKGAFLHDVGKLGIRDNILLKPGKLTEEEFSVMKTHVAHGLEITSRASWLADAQAVVGGHHEKYDGAGYPAALSGDSIPVAARIFAITDVFDALTSKRPYKEPMSFDDTMNIMEEGRARHFDPELLDAFSAIARTLYDTYSGREDEKPRRDLDGITQEYFKRDVTDLFE